MKKSDAMATMTIKAKNVEVYRIWDTYYIKNANSGNIATFTL